MTKDSKVYLTESYTLRNTDPQWDECERMRYLAKNIYNATTYVLRQAFFADAKRGIAWDHDSRMWTKLLNNSLSKLIRKEYPDAYHAVPNRVVKGVVRSVVGNWKGFKQARQDWIKHPYKYMGEPRAPRYKPTGNTGRAVCIWNDHKSVSKPACNQYSIIQMSGCDISVRLGDHVYDCIREIEGLTPDTPIEFWQRIAHIRLIPQGSSYTFEVVYTVIPKPYDGLNPAFVMGIDLGVNNLMAITSNKSGFQPILVNGRPVKSINQYFNKKRAKLQSKLPEGQYSSKRLKRLYRIRSRRIKDYLHTASKWVVNTAIDEGIGVIVIGQNKNWKQRANMGKRNNQTFLSIPHRQLIEMVQYKAKLAGIEVICQEESYTSKCSFLDLEPIQKHGKYAGRRVKRGMFVASSGQQLNADVNASYNIIRKAVLNAFANGIEDVAVYPLAIAL